MEGLFCLFLTFLYNLLDSTRPRSLVEEQGTPRKKRRWIDPNSIVRNSFNIHYLLDLILCMS